MLRRAAGRSRGVVARLPMTRSFAKKASPAQSVLRPIHFEHDEDVGPVLHVSLYP